MTLSNHKDIDNLNNARLSVQISFNGLSFLVTTPHRQEAAFFKEVDLQHSTTPEELLYEVEQTLAQNPVFETPFREIAVVYATPVYTLVPTHLFDASKASEYLKFNSKILPNDYIATDVLDELNITVVYVPFMNINNFFFEKYGSFDYFHSASILIKKLVQHQNFPSPHIFLHFLDNHFDCIILKNGQLDLCNSYNYKTPEDFIYFTLFSMEQLNLDPEVVPVYLCGNVGKDDKVFEYAYRYIRNVAFLSPDPLTAKIENTEPHKHFLLKNL